MPIVECILWVVLFVFGVVGFRYALEFIISIIPSTQSAITVIRPAQIGWDNGLPLLMWYLFIMSSFVACGYAMGMKASKRR